MRLSFSLLVLLALCFFYSERTEMRRLTIIDTDQKILVNTRNKHVDVPRSGDFLCIGEIASDEDECPYRLNGTFYLVTRVVHNVCHIKNEARFKATIVVTVERNQRG